MSLIWCRCLQLWQPCPVRPHHCSDIRDCRCEAMNRAVWQQHEATRKYTAQEPLKTASVTEERIQELQWKERLQNCRRRAFNITKIKAFWAVFKRKKKISLLRTGEPQELKMFYYPVIQWYRISTVHIGDTTWLISYLGYICIQNKGMCTSAMHLSHPKVDAEMDRMSSILNIWVFFHFRYSLL